MDDDDFGGFGGFGGGDFDGGGGGGGMFGDDRGGGGGGGKGKKGSTYVHPMLAARGGRGRGRGGGLQQFDDDADEKERRSRKGGRGRGGRDDDDTRPKSSVPLHIQQERAAKAVFGDKGIPSDANFNKHTTNLQFQKAVPNFLAIMKEQAAKKTMCGGGGGDPSKDKAFFKFTDTLPTLGDKRAPLLDDDAPVVDAKDASKVKAAPTDEDELENEAVQRALREYEEEQLQLKREIYGEQYDPKLSEAENQARTRTFYQHVWSTVEMVDLIASYNRR
jgi:hypothetical protein